MTDYRAVARQIAAEYGIDPNIFEAQIQQESGFDPTAESKAGAKGIAQLMPAHWKAVNPLDPVSSLRYAAGLMAGYLKQYGGDYATALAAYNAGPGNVDKYGGVPPFEETQAYVKNILGAQQKSANGGGDMPGMKMPDVPYTDTFTYDKNGNVVGKQRTFSNGEVWIIPMVVQPGEHFWDKGTQTFPEDQAYPDEKTSALIARRWDAQNKSGQEPSQTAQWSVQTKPDGSKVLVNELTGEVKPLQGFGATVKTQTYKDPQDGSEWIVNSETGEKIKQLSPPIPGYIPGVGVQAPQRLAPRYPEQQQLDQLQVQKAQRDLANPYTLAQQQHEEAINNIQQQLASGQIDVNEANRRMDLLRQNFNASLMGTTPFEMQKNRQSVASNVLNNRMQMGSNMAQSLLSGAGSIYGKILGGQAPPLDFNPLSMAQGFTDQMGGGPDMSQLARSVLMGAMQQPQGGGF